VCFPALRPDAGDLQAVPHDGAGGGQGVSDRRGSGSVSHPEHHQPFSEKEHRPQGGAGGGGQPEAPSADEERF